MWTRIFGASRVHENGRCSDDINLTAIFEGASLARMCAEKTESVLVIVLAETRGSEQTYKLFEKNLLQELGADLALCVANNERENPANPFYQNAMFVWTCEEPEDWGDAFDSAMRSKGLESNWRELLKIGDQWLGGVRGPNAHPGSAGILLFFRLFLKDCLLKSGVLEQYDRFVITRSDFMHRVPHVPLKMLDPNYIWIPDGEQYGGFTDRHIVVSRGDVSNALSIADSILEDPQGLFAAMKGFTKWNVEKFIKFRFKQLGLLPRVRLFPYTMYAVRAVDGHTSWSTGRYHPKLGYCIKYRHEYRRFRKARVALLLTGGWNRLSVKVYYWLVNSKERKQGEENLRFNEYIR